MCTYTITYTNMLKGIFLTEATRALRLPPMRFRDDADVLRFFERGQREKLLAWAEGLHPRVGEGSTVQVRTRYMCIHGIYICVYVYIRRYIYIQHSCAGENEIYTYTWHIYICVYIYIRYAYTRCIYLYSIAVQVRTREEQEP